MRIRKSASGSVVSLAGKDLLVRQLFGARAPAGSKVADAGGIPGLTAEVLGASPGAPVAPFAEEWKRKRRARGPVLSQRDEEALREVAREAARQTGRMVVKLSYRGRRVVVPL